jgi:Zn-dependent peptidase ImmA (M78 family)
MVDQLLKQNGQMRPPVQIEVIATRLGTEIRKGNLGNVSGLIVRKGNNAIIGVNSKQVRQRQRFTIAHELGHFLLHEGLAHHVDHDYRVNYRSDESSKATNVEEIEANFFAASILMPKNLLDELNAIDSVESGERVAYLAKLFDVSQHAMSLRLNNLYGEYAPF